MLVFDQVERLAWGSWWFVFDIFHLRPVTFSAVEAIASFNSEPVMAVGDKRINFAARVESCGQSIPIT